MVQIQLRPLPQHMDPVPTARNILIVQRLVDIADEMHDELGGLRTQPGRDGWVRHLRRVIGDGGYNAAFFLAVPVKIDSAVSGRVVLRVYEVEDAREMAPFGVADAVCPGRDAGKIVGVTRAAEERLKVGLCLGLDEVAGYVCYSNVAESWTVM